MKKIVKVRFESDPFYLFVDKKKIAKKLFSIKNEKPKPKPKKDY